jgi:predicted dehydrogenase
LRLSSLLDMNLTRSKPSPSHRAARDLSPDVVARLHRRAFLRTTALGGAMVAFGAPALLRGQNLNNRLGIGIIGCGGRGGFAVDQSRGENIVALCDVAEDRLNQVGTKHPRARRYVDFRKLLDSVRDLDAVTVSTADHTHAFATLWALQQRKHVYCEKPLTHSIEEARVIAEAAAEARVATQMGTQIHASSNYRRVVELIQTGAVGPVREVHVWLSRAWGWQTREEAQVNQDIISTQDRPVGSSPVPAGLHWDLFVGPAPDRPFHEVYWPGPRWYRWWDFGGGTMSDMGSHLNDLPFWALELRDPLTIEAEGPPPHREIAPASMTARYTYGARGPLPPVTMTWYQGTRKPVYFTERKIPQWGMAILFVGDQGMLLSDYGRHVLLPEEKFKGYQRPAPFIPESPGHFEEWLMACKTGSPTGSNFAYAARLTIANHLGNVAYRVGQKIEWDPVGLKARNVPAADRLIRTPYRQGWKLA